MEVRKTSEYKGTSAEETFRLLGSTANGLSEFEANGRLRASGFNEVVEKKENSVLAFLKRYWGPMSWLLETAIVLSYLLGHYLEAVVIFALLTLNVVVEFRHTQSSKKALELLEKKLAIKAKVLRDGKWVIKEVREVVPGDVFLVGLGDIVPADAKIIDGEPSVDQSALTGESIPVDIHPSDIIYSGSIIKRGDAKAIAVNTGVNTYFGRTTELVKIARPKSHQEELMLLIVKYMMCLGIAALSLTTAYGMIFHIHGDILSIATFATIFLMGAVPVALPAVLSIVQAVGAMELVKEGALVTKLDSIEDAASIDILYLDKTGTVTQNKLAVVDVIPFPGFKREDVALLGAMASKEEGKDMIDQSVIEYARELGADCSSYKQVSFTPFDPSIKRAEAIIDEDGKRFKVIKGAPQVITSLCNGPSGEILEEVNRRVEGLSMKGYRTLGVARSRDGDLNDLELAGILAIADPARPDSRELIEQTKDLGIRPVMLTGDNIAIAKEVAQQTGFGTNLLRMSDLQGLGEDEQLRRIEGIDGIAEIYPEDKYRVVKVAQSRGHIVGMTGDGINDAPALKQAEMGIAVANATDVAKASSSVVLTEQGLRVIVNTIKVSRKTYERMLTWVINKITKTMEFTILLTVGFFWTHEIVLTLMGMALLIFSNDFATMSISTDNVESAISPRKWSIKSIIVSSFVVGILLVIEGCVVIFTSLYYFNLNLTQLQAMVMLNLIFNSQFRVLIVRERRHFWSSRPGREVILAIIAVLTAFLLLGIFGLGLFPPLATYQILWVLGYSALFTLIIDIPKYYSFRKFGLSPAADTPKEHAKEAVGGAEENSASFSEKVSIMHKMCIDKIEII
jgi:H+-transporting ATPase